MQVLDMVDESQDDDPDYDEAQLLAGNFDEWEVIVKPPQAHSQHTQKANDRSLAYARRRALDLERAPGVNDKLFDPAVVIFWDGGLAEKVEYGFTDYTSKKGLPRPPKVKDVKRWSRPDALSIKSHIRKAPQHITLEEFGTEDPDGDDPFSPEIPLDELPYVEELRPSGHVPTRIAAHFGGRFVDGDDHYHEDLTADASVGAHECEGILPRPNKAMAAAAMRPSPFDLSDEWLADTGASDDLCPVTDAQKVDKSAVITLRPRVFETAKGLMKVSQSLLLSRAINNMDLQPMLMDKKCPRAVSISRQVLDCGRSYLWLNGYLPIIFNAVTGFATPQ